MMKVKGQVVSAVSNTPKGVGFKIFISDFGDTFRVFIPTEKLSGQGSLKMMDAVDVTLNRFFPSGNEVRLDVLDVQKTK